MKDLHSYVNKVLESMFTSRVLILLGLFISFIFLRFYQLEERMQFTWDQIQNSWVMKDMLIDHKMPLEGMVAKLNSGFHIGPAYYYLLAPFYALFRLDPIANGVFAGIMSLLTFFVLYQVTKRLFSEKVAIISLFIYTFSYHAIIQDRIAWPVLLIPVVSLLIFYFLIESLELHKKALLGLAFSLGLSLHVHFTSIFYFIITLFVSPLFIIHKKLWKWMILAIPLLFVWLVPNILVAINNNFSSSQNLLTYIQTYYHGLHIVRVLQLLGDAFIEVQSVLFISLPFYVRYLVFLLFCAVYLRDEKKVKNRKILLVTLLWFAVPLMVFSLYRGEISDYYFRLTMPIVCLLLAYTLYEFMKMHSAAFVTGLVLLTFWAFVNVRTFVSTKYVALPKMRQHVLQAISKGETIEFADGNPESYLYYIYTRNLGIK